MYLVVSLIVETKITTMKAKLLPLWIFLAFSVFTFQTAAQSVVESATVESLSTNMRGDPVVLKFVKITVSEPGTVVVDFDGKCVSSPGDQIRLAASNTDDWDVNDGGVTIEAYDDDINRHSFSHTRAYAVTTGDHTFYAVGENKGKTAGSGIASVYGELVARFFPNSGKAKVYHTGIVKTNENVCGAPVSLASHTINTLGAGKVLVRFNGYCSSSPGDLIVLAASDHENWVVNDGNTAIQAINDDITKRVFNHTRLYPMAAGTHTFHAVVQNYVETAGTGITSVYGSLTAIYYPDNMKMTVDHEAISYTNIDVKGGTVTLGKVDINPAVSGKAVVTFDGLCVSSSGDRIVLATSDGPYWLPNAGNVNVEAISADLNNNNFSHTQTYNLAPGDHSFYAVAQNYVEMDGTGEASFYGSLTVQFFPDVNSGIFNTPSNASADIVLWPNPASDVLQVSIKNFPAGKAVLEVYDFTGRLLKRTEPRPDNTFTLDVSAYRTGNYLIRITNESITVTRKFMVM